MMKTLAKLFGSHSPEATGLINLEPHRGEVEFALVLIEADSDQQTAWTVASVSEEAIAFQGVVLQITGPLLFIAFSGVVGQSAPSQRGAFVTQITQKHRILVRVLHGKRGAMIGTLGGELRRSYTAVLDDFKGLLGQLAQLKPGEAVET